MTNSKHRIALVTGGMGGLGEAICIKLADMGITVAVTYSATNTKSADWLAQMKTRGFNFHAFQVDVGDFESCAAAIKKVEADVDRKSVV